MKIAYYTSNRVRFPVPAGEIAASSTVTADIINGLKEKHEITLYAAKGSFCEGVTVKEIELPPISIDSSSTNQDWTTKAVLGMKMIPLGELLKDADQYDIIHLQTEPVYLGMPFAKLIKTPILFTCHHPFFEIDRRIFEYFDGKVNMSALSGFHAASFPLSHRPDFVYNGIDIENYDFNPDPQGYYLFLGRLVAEKGIDDFIELAEKTPDQEFYIAGGGSMAKLAEEAAQKHSNVKYLGLLGRNSEPWKDALAKAKALISPVKCNESFGLAMAEALAFGTPVIAYQKGSVPELVDHGVNGFIVKEESVSGLKEAVDQLEKMPADDYRAMRLAARKKVEDNFSISAMAQGYEKLYQKIIEKHSS